MNASKHSVTTDYRYNETKINWILNYKIYQCLIQFIFKCEGWVWWALSRLQILYCRFVSLNHKLLRLMFKVFFCWLNQDSTMLSFMKIWLYADRSKCFWSEPDHSFIQMILMFRMDHMWMISLVAITPNQQFCQVYDIWQLVYMIQWFLFRYEKFHKCKLVNLSPVSPNVFIIKTYKLLVKVALWKDESHELTKMLPIGSGYYRHDLVYRWCKVITKFKFRPMSFTLTSNYHP